MLELFYFFLFWIFFISLPGSLFLAEISIESFIIGSSISIGFIIISLELLSLFKITITFSLCVSIIIFIYLCSILYLKLSKNKIKFKRSSLLLLIPFFIVFLKYYLTKNIISLPGLDILAHCFKTKIMFENNSVFASIFNFPFKGNYFYPSGLHIILLFSKYITNISITKIFIYFFYMLSSIFPVLIYFLCENIGLKKRNSYIALLLSMFSYSILFSLWKFSLLPSFLSIFIFLCFILLKNFNFILKLIVFYGFITIHPHLPVIFTISLIIFSIINKKIDSELFIIIFISLIMVILINYNKLLEFYAIFKFSTPLNNFSHYNKTFTIPNGFASIKSLFICYFYLDIVFFILLLKGYLNSFKLKCSILSKIIPFIGIIFLFSVVFDYFKFKQFYSLTWRMLIIFDLFNPIIIAFIIDKINFIEKLKNKLFFSLCSIGFIFHIFIIIVIFNSSFKNLNNNSSFISDDIKAYKWINKYTTKNDAFLGCYDQISNGVQWINYFTKRKVFYMWGQHKYYKVWKKLIDNSKKLKFNYLKKAGISYIYLSKRNLVKTKMYFNKKEIDNIIKNSNIAYKNKSVTIIRLK